MKNKKYIIFPLFVLLVIIFIRKYFILYNISEKLFNLSTGMNEKTIFFKEIILKIFIIFIIILLIQVIINFIFKKIEIEIIIKKIKIELSKIYYFIIRSLRVIIILLSICIVMHNLTIYKGLFINLKQNEIEKIYYKNYKNINLITNNNNNYFINKNMYIFPEPKNIINIDIDTLGQTLPISKNEDKINTIVTLVVDDISLTTYATIKVQGSSTTKWPKKNWTINFFKDELREEEIKIKIGDSIFSNKWIAKADWNDPSLLRNYLSYALFDNIINAREREKKYEVLNSDINNLGAQGFPKTHPILINMDNEFYGLSLLTLGHDPNNFNINKENENHLYFEFDSRGARYNFDTTKTWKKFTSQGIGTWIDSYYPKDNNFSKDQIKAIDKLGKFINSKQSNFNKKFDKYLDKDNMIDMFLFIELIYDWDGVCQDLEIVTYDLQKWYFLPWDKDTTFGMFYDGSGLLEDAENKILIDPNKKQESHILWRKTYKAHKKEIEKRYAILRDENIFTVDNLINLIDDLYNKIPKDLWETEKNKWEPLGKVSTTETNKKQIIKWFEARLKTLDKHFKY